MRSLAVLLFLTVGLVGISAQTEKPITDWKALDQPNDEFSIEVPEGFEYRMPGLPHNKIIARGEFHSDSDRFYIFVDTPKEPNQRKRVEAFLRYANQTASSFDLLGYEAQKAEFDDPTGFYHTVIFVETPSRVFTLQTVSKSKNSEAAVRFMNSFRLLPKSVTDGTPKQPGLAVNPESNAISLDTPTPVQPVGGGMSSRGDQGSGSGTAYGNAPGSSSGVSTGTQQTPPKSTSPLKVLYKQKAQYTDFARFYLIQGNVTLRVTFVASGEIGSITTIKKLPFGLTESAIYAARSMKFDPETVNGVARTTTRPVSFQFNIY